MTIRNTTTSKKILFLTAFFIFAININLAYALTINQIEYSGSLKDSTFAWKSTYYNYQEKIALDSYFFTSTVNKFNIAALDKYIVTPGALVYKYIFDDSINFGGTITSPDYTYPIVIKILDKEFSIIGIGSSSIKVLQGSTGTATTTIPVVYGSYSFYAVLGATDAWVKINVTDSSGMVVASEVVNAGSTKTFSSIGLDVKAIAVRALQDGTIVGADLVVGPTGTIEKEYDTAADVESSGTASDKFPGETRWGIQVSNSGFTSGYINSGAEIQVVYRPLTNQQYSAGEKINMPNNYGYIGFISIATTTMTTQSPTTTTTTTPKCAKEGEYTSGPVSPEYQYGCCEGLEGFNTNRNLVGGGLLCYNPKKGEPVCKAVGTRSEGWYYSKTGELLRYEVCGSIKSACEKACNDRGYNFGSCRMKECKKGEFSIGKDNCPQPMCAPCVIGVACPPCPSDYCCCSNKKECPFECCESDPNYLDKNCPVAAVGCVCACPVGAATCPPCKCPEPPKSVCKDHKCVPESPGKYTLRFYSGWNLFSIPVKFGYATTTTPSVETTKIFSKAATAASSEGGGGGAERICAYDSLASKIWHYSNGKYVEATSIEPGEGYWVKIRYSCVVIVEGSPVTISDFPELNAGWNQIGSTSDVVHFSDVTGDCKVAGGPWKFNAAAKKYEKAENIMPGEGYWINVEAACKFGESEMPPEPPSLASAIGKILGQMIRVGG